MRKIQSKYGHRYPVYNDKQNYCEGRWNLFNCSGIRIGSYFPAPLEVKPILPRPTILTKHKIIQPKANAGYLRGQRNFKRS